MPYSASEILNEAILAVFKSHYGALPKLTQTEIETAMSTIPPDPAFKKPAKAASYFADPPTAKNKSKKGMQLIASRNLPHNKIELYGTIASEDGTAIAMQAPAWGECDTASVDTKPFLSLDYEVVQQLVNELANLGIVATKSGKEIDAAAKEMAAVREHLKDMRDIAFSFIQLQK